MSKYYKKLPATPSSSATNNEADTKNTIKFLILACRSLTNVLIESKLPPSELNLMTQPKQLTPKEVNVFIKMLIYSIKSLEVYSTSSQTRANKNISQANNLQNQKDEKEIIENLGVIFSYLNNSNLFQIFTQTIDFIVDETIKNPNLATLTSYFLATPATSCIFSTILIENLLKKMELMGDLSQEKSNLYLKLFKLVFGSVSVFPLENEKMLKPHLHTLVNKSLEYSLKSKEPYNYFLLMRALFRSIGGGNHDLLYQEFLPLLPLLLLSLNELQTGLHKQHLKDLFVELCLTVPVRLSSLLPYLPMLMDPLVSALNGSQTLISQVIKHPT
jgi:transformation/transcription domain-associated protein